LISPSAASHLTPSGLTSIVLNTFFERLDLRLRFLKMSFDSGLQLCVLYGASDVRKRFGDCVFCVVDIHERVLEQFGESFHGDFLFGDLQQRKCEPFVPRGAKLLITSKVCAQENVKRISRIQCQRKVTGTIRDGHR
jgi:hypothetical protein